MKTWDQWVNENHPDLQEQLSTYGSAMGNPPVPRAQPMPTFNQDVQLGAFLKAFPRNVQVKAQSALSRSGMLRGTLSPSTVIPASLAQQVAQQIMGAPAPVAAPSGLAPADIETSFDSHGGRS